MVDLLGQAGRVNEAAYSSVKDMSIDLNVSCGVLLTACQGYSNMDVGLITANKLFQIVPQQAGGYVLFLNIHVKAEIWQDVTTVRSMMKSSGIHKTPGVRMLRSIMGFSLFLQLTDHILSL